MTTRAKYRVIKAIPGRDHCLVSLGVKRGAASAQRGVCAATFNLKVSLTLGAEYFAVSALYAHWLKFASFLEDRVKSLNVSATSTPREDPLATAAKGHSSPNELIKRT